MESKAKFLGHPIHPILIVFPLGLLATSFGFDIAYLIQGDGTFAMVSFWVMVVGICGALLAGVFGLIDWWAIPAGTRAKTIGLWHGGGNIIVTLLFIASWSIRRSAPASPTQTAIALSGAAVLIALITGWLGGELVDRLGVGVDPGAHLNAPNSLSNLPAHASHEQASSGTSRRHPV